MKKLFTWFCLVVFSVGSIHAQTSGIIIDEEALFGDPDDMIESQADHTAVFNSTSAAWGSLSDEEALFDDELVVKVQSGSAAAAVSAFLVSDSVKLGGSFTGSLGADWSWTDPWNGNHDPAKPDSEQLTATVGSLFYFNARPTEDYRIYASVKTSWPFTAISNNTNIPNIQVFEIFSDFNWQDQLFFRFGKHSVKWGVGYFWSPADVINLQGIDVQDPTAQREGPISLRAHFPVPGSQHNLWAYILVPTIANPWELVPADIGLAAKAEFLIGNWELGIGGFYQQAKAPKAMLTATGSLGQVALFTEAVLGWGSDKDWVTDITDSLPFLVTTKDDENWFFGGTAGFSWSKTAWNFSISGQYLFNADGYSDSERTKLISDARGVDLSGSPLEASVEDLLKGLMYNSGQHYAGLSLSKRELGLKDLSLSLLTITNLSDLSGFIKPSLSYRCFDKVSVAISSNFYWSTDLLWGGGDDGEYVILAGGPSATFSVSASLGSGKF